MPWEDLISDVGVKVSMNGSSQLAQRSLSRGDLELAVWRKCSIRLVGAPDRLSIFLMLRSDWMAWIFPPSGRCRLGDCC